MSGVRWAGVALVIASLVAAISLAVISPSDRSNAADGADAADLSPRPEAREPEVQPRIVAPVDGLTTLDREMTVTVTVPPYDLPRSSLELVVFRGDRRAGDVSRPKADDIEVGPIELVEGPNVLTAALVTSGGIGPLSEPITIVLDKVGPDVDVDTPKENARIYEGTLQVTGTAEVGTEISVQSKQAGAEVTEVVGPSGSFDIPITLAMGNNRIVVSALDSAGNALRPKIRRIVTRIDPVPKVTLRLSPNPLKLSALPREVRLSTVATDSSGRPVADAEVIFTLFIGERGAMTETATTNAKGKASWKVELSKAGLSRGDEGQASVEVTTPQGGTESSSKAIRIE